MPSTGHWRNPDDFLPPPCWNNSTNTTDNSTSVTYGVVTEDVNSVGYVILFSALVFLFGMLYCMALRAGVVDATSRRNAAIATHCDSFDAMTLKERRHYIDQVLHVKVRVSLVAPILSSYPFHIVSYVMMFGNADLHKQ